MISIQKKFTAIPNSTSKFPHITPDMVFVDIETTGFSAVKNHIYCIGCISQSASGYTFAQFFAESPSEERNILTAFFEYVKGQEISVTFNGSTFDLPFLQKRSQLLSIESTFFRMESIDLYKIAKSANHLLGLDSLKQKSIELFLGIDRKDCFSGGELIQVYRQFLQNGGEERLHLLMLHNEEDVLNMVPLSDIISYQKLLHGHFELSGAFPETGENQDELINIMLSHQYQVPVSLTKLHPDYKVHIKNEKTLIQLPVIKKELKHFFADYKNYFYLPLEDCAIHKSIGIYVDPEHREKAKKDNCYARQKGDFIFLPVQTSNGYFREDFRDKSTWISLTDFMDVINQPTKPFSESAAFIHTSICSFMNKI